MCFSTIFLLKINIWAECVKGTYPHSCDWLSTVGSCHFLYNSHSHHPAIYRTAGWIFNHPLRVLLRFTRRRLSGQRNSRGNSNLRRGTQQKWRAPCRWVYDNSDGNHKTVLQGGKPRMLLYIYIYKKRIPFICRGWVPCYLFDTLLGALVSNNEFFSVLKNIFKAVLKGKVVPRSQVFSLLFFSTVQ